MTYIGKVDKGVVLLPAGTDLPDGTQVKVEPLPSPEVSGGGEAGLSQYELLRDFIGTADDMPSDLALNHDHYLHGHPKKPR